jgi:hypothetical protein
MKKTFALIAGILALAGGMLAQNSSSSEKPQPIIVERYLSGDQKVSQPIFLLNAIDGLGKRVKGAPYTATAVTEATQTLGDGNHIVNKTTAFVARDGEGRMRREESFTRIGNLPANDFKTVMIDDPVAHIHYMSKPGGAPDEGTVISAPEPNGDKTFHVRVEGPAFRERVKVGGDNVIYQKIGHGENSEEPGAANMKREPLGTQVIEGVNAEGTRDTRTIPAGAIGNEKPIVITSETWFSPELQVVVLSKRNDPRFGETVYKLTGITRGEPDPSLFQVPEKARKELPPPK